MRALLVLVGAALALAPALADAHHGDTIRSYVAASGHFIVGTAAVGIGAVDDGEPVPDAGVGPVSLARAAFAAHPCHPDLQILLDVTPEDATLGADGTAVIIPYRFQIQIVDEETGDALPDATFDFEGSASASYPLRPEHARLTPLRADLYMLVGADVAWSLAIRGWLEHEGCVVVSEIEANPAGPDAGNEWVELANLGFGDVDVSGWTIRAHHRAPAALTLAPGTTVPGGGRLVVGFPTQFLDNADEVVTLEAADGVEYARTPALSDGAGDGRTNQLVDLTGAEWTFAAGTPAS